MSLYKTKINPTTGKLQLVPSGTILVFKAGVANFAALPAVGNTISDARITSDNGHLYVWDGLAWVDQGDIIDIDWSAITGKPTSSPANIDDAVSKRHTQNTDTILDDGGANEVSAAEIRTFIDNPSTPIVDGKLQQDLDMNGYTFLNFVNPLAARASFVNADLSSGILTVTHNLGYKYVVVQVYDNNDNLILPDEITVIDTDSLTIDLTSFGTITGTWNYIVLA